MSYLVQAKLARDPDIQQRVTACAATEGIPDPQFWVNERGWKFSAQPRWVEQYKAAQGEAPGADESAVTDQMILTAVRELRAEELTPPPSSPETPTSPAE